MKLNANFLKALGPGILFASTAIGVSHLVQSTRAGANFGFTLLWAVILANLFKYPFFEYGSRYANVKQKSIIDGYNDMGKWMLTLYLLITLGTMFFVSAAVGAVTAGFMDNLFNFGAFFGQKSLLITTIVLFIIGLTILLIGRYKTLDSIIKVIASVLLASTVLAFVLCLFNGPTYQGSMFKEFTWVGTDAAFLIALMGWMPTAVDLSTWNSLWTIERMEQTGYKPTLKETLTDFNIGYIISAVLAICFLTMGAFMFFGTSEELSNSSATFANQVVSIFTHNIGEWSYWIIAAAGFSIMFGTFIAILDGYARSLQSILMLYQNSARTSKAGFYNGSLVFTAIGAFAIIYYYLFATSNPAGFKNLVDIATTLSFLVAPIIAIVNYKLVTDKHFPKDAQPPLWMKVISILGILFLTGFSIYFLVI